MMRAILVEVEAELLGADGALVGAEQPALERRGDHSWRRVTQPGKRAASAR